MYSHSRTVYFYMLLSAKAVTAHMVEKNKIFHNAWLADASASRRWKMLQRKGYGFKLMRAKNGGKGWGWWGWVENRTFSSI